VDSGDGAKKERPRGSFGPARPESSTLHNQPSDYISLNTLPEGLGATAALSKTYETRECVACVSPIEEACASEQVDTKQIRGYSMPLPRTASQFSAQDIWSESAMRRKTHYAKAAYKEAADSGDFGWHHEDASTREPIH